MDKLDFEDKKKRYKSLVIDGTKYRTLLTKKYENKKSWSKPRKNRIISFIPGTILILYVREGQCVMKGDDLLILEAMKMQNLIKSPLEGIIKSIKVKEGQRIPKGTLMIELGFL
jgi:biotin carboxyl carrier protein